MGRLSSSSVPACPTLFTPLQAHPRELLRFGVASWVGWMRDHTISLQRMGEHHRFAVVVAGASLTFSGVRRFHDGETIDIETTSSVHREGVLIQGRSWFSSQGREFACMSINFRPVCIGDENSAAARPSNLHPDVLALFQPGEISPKPYVRPLKRVVPALEAEGVRLADARQPFKLHRYAMDFADQWAFVEAAAFASASREELALSQGGAHQRLVEALSQPVSEFHVDLARPYFLFDQGVVETQAYLWNDHLFFVHRLVQEQHDQRQVHATVVEQMARPAPVGTAAK